MSITATPPRPKTTHIQINKEAKMASPITTSELKAGSLKPLFTRLTWMLFGYPLLFGLVLVIAINDHAPTSATSLAVWAVVGAVIAARYIDVVSFNGKTSECDRPATLSDVKKFSLSLTVFAAFLWSAAIML